MGRQESSLCLLSCMLGMVMWLVLDCFLYCIRQINMEALGTPLIFATDRLLVYLCAILIIVSGTWWFWFQGKSILAFLVLIFSSVFSPLILGSICSQPREDILIISFSFCFASVAAAFWAFMSTIAKSQTSTRCPFKNN